MWGTLENSPKSRKNASGKSLALNPTRLIARSYHQRKGLAEFSREFSIFPESLRIRVQNVSRIFPTPSVDGITKVS